MNLKMNLKLNKLIPFIDTGCIIPLGLSRVQDGRNWFLCLKIKIPFLRKMGYSYIERKEVKMSYYVMLTFKYAPRVFWAE